MRSRLAILLLAAPVAAQSTSTGTFITRLGTDTLALESFQRTPSQIQGAILWRSPAFGAARYTVSLNPNGSAKRALLTNILEPNDRDKLYSYDSVVVSFVGDSAIVDWPTGLRTPRALAGVGAFAVNYSWALRELQLLAFRASGLDSARSLSNGVTVSGLYTSNIYLKSIGRDSVEMPAINGVGPITFATDARHRLLNGDARRSTSKYTVERSETLLDIPSLAATFLVAERNGKAFGSVISTRDTARFSLGPSNISIDYTRPRLHGRRVFVGGVLGDTLWRTGANRATHLTLTTDLRIGGTLVKAGTYTVYTSIAPDNSRYTLILNGQTGQWGTTYDRARDVARIPLRARQVPSTEYLTFGLRSTAATRGELTLTWDQTELSVSVDIP